MCDVCLGFDMIDITEMYAMMCPTTLIGCTGAEEMKLKMDCVTMGDEEEDEIGSISHGLTKFGLNLLNTVTLMRGEDAFAAPFSVANALLPTAVASSGVTREEILKTLQIPELEVNIGELSESYGGMVNGIQHLDEDVTSVAISSLWIAKQYYQRISHSFKEHFLRFGEVRTVNLSDPTFVTGEINAYISELSRGHISSAIQNNLQQNSLSIFTNIMYFTVQWQNPFEHMLVEKFRDGTGQEYEVQMMTSPDMQYSVSSTQQMELIEVPLKQGFSNFGFFLVRPRLEGMADTIEVEKELKATEFKFFSEGSKALLHAFALPAFTMFYCQDLTDELRVLGIKDIFDPVLSNMSAFFEDDKTNAYEDGFNHQGWIQVNQHGFTIASFAGDGVGKETARSGKVMHADKPFIFLVFEKSTSTLMFAGRITNPNGWRLDYHAKHKHINGTNWFGYFFGLFFFGILGYCV